MKIHSVHIGTWFQRTDLHLREIYKFLSNGDLQGLENQKLDDLRATLGKYDLKFSEGLTNALHINTDKITTEITEDGVVLLSKTYQDAKEDIAILKHQYEDLLSPALTYVFSRGAPLPKELANIKLVYPYFFVAEGATEKDVEDVLKNFDDNLVSTVKGKNLTLFIGKVGTTLSFSGKEDLEKAQEIIKYGIFFREFETQLSQYLNLHRTIWEEMDQIRSKKSINRGDFPRIRNKLIERKKFLSFVSARLNQMEHLIIEREKYAEGQKIKDELAQISWDSFASLMATHKYVEELWKMTKEYVDATVELLQIFYQESTQKELVALEIISIFNVVIGLVNFFKSVEVIDLVVIMSSSAVFYVTLKYLIRGRKFTLPEN